MTPMKSCSALDPERSISNQLTDIMASGHITLQTDMTLSNVLSNLTKTSLDLRTRSRHTKLRHAERKDWLGVYRDTSTRMSKEEKTTSSTATWKANHSSRAFLGSAEFDLSALAIGWKV